MHKPGKTTDDKLCTAYNEKVTGSNHRTRTLDGFSEEPVRYEGLKCTLKDQKRSIASATTLKVHRTTNFIS